MFSLCFISYDLKCPLDGDLLVASKALLQFPLNFCCGYSIFVKRQLTAFWWFLQFINSGKCMTVFSTGQRWQRTVFNSKSVSLSMTMFRRTRPPNKEVVSKLCTDFRRNETTWKSVKRYTAQTKNGRSGSK